MSMPSQAEPKVDMNYDPLNDFSEVIDPKQNAGLIPTFYLFAEKNNFESSRQVRPVFDEKVFLRIERVGDKLSVNEREASDYDKARFANEYQAFKRGDSQMQGVPVEMLPGLSVSRIAELKACKIHTVQGLAEVPDSALKLVGMDAIQLRDKARDFLVAINAERGEKVIERVEQAANAGLGRIDVLEHDMQHLKEGMQGITGMLQQFLATQTAPAAVGIVVPLEIPANSSKKDIL